jgi:hypothetical protein
MIPKRSRQRAPSTQVIERGQPSRERHHYSAGVDDPEAPVAAKEAGSQ